MGVRVRTAKGIVLWADRAARVPAHAWWLVVASWYGLVFMLSAAPGLDATSTENLLDIIALGDLNGLVRLSAHMGLFGALAVWIYLAIRYRTAEPSEASDPADCITSANCNIGRSGLERGSLPGHARRYVRFGTAVLLSGLLGVSDELHQAFVPGRHGRLQDVLYVAVGAVLVLTITLRAVRWARGVLEAAQTGKDGSRDTRART